MTPEQIKARCEQYLYSGETLESLYREAMAVGIKLASRTLLQEFTSLASECEKEADMLKDGATLKEPT